MLKLDPAHQFGGLRAGAVVGATTRSSQRHKTAVSRLALIAAGVWIVQGHASAATVGATALPTGGTVTSGAANIGQSGSTLTVNQQSQNLSLGWQSFNIGSGATVDFVQPNSQSVAVNRILGNDGSQILGQLNANGQVFLINPNGVLFGKTAQVNVGGLVASTLDVSDSELGTGKLTFSGAGKGKVVNDGTITAAQGGYVALVGNSVINGGVITARLGSVALVGGSAATLSFDGASLIDVQVDQSTLNALAQNDQLVAADGGRVWMTAGAHDSLLASAVNNTGVVQAQTVGGHDGHILLLSGMSAGTTTVSGTVDASAPGGGNGGAIETSGHTLKVADDATLTTAAPQGATGSWLIDPADFWVLANGGDITGAALTNALKSNDVTIQTTIGAPSTTGANGGSGTSGSGNIYVGDAVNWTSHTLTLNAYNDVDIYAPMTASGTAGLTLFTGQSGLRDTTHGNVNVGFDTTGAFAGAVNLSATASLHINGENYSIITTAAQLQAIQNNRGGRYALGSNITMSEGMTAVEPGLAGVDLPSQFTGIFDGLGHTVSGVSLSSSTLGVGLFGGNAGVIQNVAVDGSIVSGGPAGGSIGGLLVGWNSGTVRNTASSGSADGENGAYNIGGLVGVNTGSIFNSHSSAMVTNKDGSALASGGLVGGNYGGSIANSYATGSVHAGHYVGGLVGLNSPNGNGYVPGGQFEGTSSISQSFATGAVSGYSDVGGLVGDNVGSSDALMYATISDSYATGKVTSAGGGMAGGLVGAMGVYGESRDAGYASVNNSYSTGAVSDIDGGGGVGGLIGCNSCIAGQFGGGGIGGSGVVNNSYWDITTSGQSDSDGGMGLFDPQMTDGAMFGGFDGSIWQFSGGYGLLINDMVPLTVFLGNASKTYDGQAFSTNGLSPTYSIAGAGDNLVGELIVGGDAAGAKNAGTYTLVGGGLSNATTGQFGYNIRYAASTLTINRKALSGTIGAGSSTYGDLLTPGAVSLDPSGIIDGDDVSLGSQVVSVDTTGLTSSSGHLVAGLHTGIETATGTLSGASAGNYTFSGATGDYRVNQRELGGQIAAGGSTYGQILAPGAVTLSNLVKGDAVSASTVTVDTTGNVSSSGHLNAGSYKGIESVDGSLSGADAGNYTFAGASGDYVVEKLALNGAISTGETTYGDELAGGKATFENLVDGDMVSAEVTVSTTGQLSSSGNLKAGLHVGAESVSGLSGDDAGNYTIGEVGGDYRVGKLVLTGAIGAGGSTYGDSLASGAASFDNALKGDSLGVATVTVNTTGLLSSSKHLIAGAHTGIETVTALSGADAGNYDFTGVAGDYTVAQRELTGSISAGSSTYGATLTPGAVTFDNVIEGDGVASTGVVKVDTAGNLSTSGHLNAGSYKGAENVGGALGGEDSGNYTFAGATGDYSVDKLALNGTIATGETTYGQTLAPGAASFENLVDGDLVSATVTVATAGQLSGSGHLVAGTHSGAESVSALSGHDSGNYTIGEVGGDYKVDKLALTGSIGTGSSVYGSTLAPGSASLTNLLDGDSVTAGAVTVNTTGLLSGSEHLVAGTHTGIESLSGLKGEDSGNYSFAGVTGDYTVTKLALTGSIGAGSSVYGSELTPGSASLTNVLDGDDVGVSSVTVATNGLTSTSGHLKAGSYTGGETIAALNGEDSSNYSFGGVTGDYTVEKLALTGSIAAGQSVYGSTLAPGAASFTNAISGDKLGTATVTVATAGQLSGSGHLVAGLHEGAESVTGLSGVDAANYSFGEVSGNYTVEKLALTGSIGTGSSVYGSTLAPGSAKLTNLLDGDSVTAGAVAVNTTGLLSGSEHLVAGTHTGIESLSGLKGEDSGNYSFAGVTGDYTVTKLALTGSIGAGSSVYGSELTPGSASLTNVLDGDDVGVSSVTVATNGLTSTSGHLKAGSYTGGETIAALNGEDSSNYSFAGVTGDYTVEKLALTGSIAAGQSVYGSTLAPGAASFTNAISGDKLGTATVTVATAGQLSGSGHLVAGLHEGAESVTGLSGVDAANYSFGEVSGNYTVDKLALTGSIGTGSSVYGSTLAPGSAKLTNLLDGDSVTAGAVAVNTTGLLSGSEHLVAGTHTGIESLSGLKGEDSGNYSFAGVTGDYTVTKLALTGSIGTGSSVYGSELTPGSASLTNLLDGDDVAAGTIAVATAGHTSSSGHLTAGTHTGAESIANLVGEDAANYSFGGVSGDYTVGQLVLTGSISTGSSVYGSALAPGSVSFTNVVGADDLGQATVAVATAGHTSSSGHLTAGAHLGAESITGLSGVDAANYSFGEVSGNYQVAQLALSGSISAANSVYGSALTPGSASLSNAVSGDDVAAAGTVSVNTTGLTSTSGHLVAGAHTGIQSVNGSLSGEDAANYSFAGATGEYTVTKLALSGSIATGGSVYGSPLTPGAVSFTNAVSGDAVNAAGVVAVATAGQTSTSGHLIAGTHAGAESVDGSLGGADAGNYSFAGATGDYTVSKLTVSVTATGVDKLFDGTTNDAAIAHVSGLDGDLLTASYTAANFDDANPGNDKAVTVTGIGLGGADAQNYALANTSAATTADITPATPPAPVQSTTTDVLKLVIVQPPSVQFNWSASRVDVVDGGMKLPD